MELTPYLVLPSRRQTLLLFLTVLAVQWKLCVSDGNSLVQQNANKLIDFLFTNYTTLIRPRINQSETVEVHFDIAMKQVIDVDVKTQQMTLFLWQRQTWIDDFLKWDPDVFGGIDQLFISPTRIWVSDVIFQNSVDEFEQLKDTTIIKALVLYSGQVYFFRPTLKSTTCKMSVRYFPYDAQVCSFQVGSWMLSEDQVDIQVLAFDSAVSGFVTHHEWHLAERRTFRCSMTVPVNMGTLQKNMSFPFLEFLFLFQRKPEFFEKNLIVPTALICALSIVAFLLPNESGEKIGFSITVFLSLCVNLVVITSYVPASSESFPIIGQYYLTCIFLVAVSIVLTTCILSVHYFGDQYFIKPLPVAVKKIFFEVLAPMVGMQCLRRCSNCITLKSSRNRFQSKCKTTSSSAPSNRTTDIFQRWRRRANSNTNRHMFISAANDRCTNFAALKLGKNKTNHQPTVLRNSKVSTFNHIDTYFHLNSTSHDDSTTYDGNGLETSPDMNQDKSQQLEFAAIRETASLTSDEEIFPNMATGNNLNKNAAKPSPDSKSMNLPPSESNDSSAIPAVAYQRYSSPESNLKFAAAKRALADSNSTVSAAPFSTNSLLALPRRSSEIGSCSCIEINPGVFEKELGGVEENQLPPYESMIIDEKISKMTNSHSAPTESTVADASDDFQRKLSSRINREKSSSCSGLLSSFDDLKRSLQKIEHYLESVSKASEKKKKKCVTIEEWKLLSRILDRIFAIAYGLTTLLLTCYFFVQARSGEVELAKECKV